MENAVQPAKPPVFKQAFVLQGDFQDAKAFVHRQATGFMLSHRLP
jgi:hypothetical protein